MNTPKLYVNNTLLTWGFTALLIIWVAVKAAEKNPKATAAIIATAQKTVKWIQLKLKKK